MKNNSEDMRLKREMSNLVMDVLDHTGLDTIALSAKLDVDERSIRRWLNGEVLPNLASYFKLRGLLTEGGDDDSPPYYFISYGHMCRAICFFICYSPMENINEEEKRYE